MNNGTNYIHVIQYIAIKSKLLKTCLHGKKQLITISDTIYDSFIRNAVPYDKNIIQFEVY